MLENIFKSYLRILALIKKEFLTILMDKSSRLILIAPVIMQCIIFGYGASYHLEHVPYVICNDSNDHLAYEIENELLHTPKFELTANCRSRQCVKESVDREQSLLGIYIASDFKTTHQILVVTDARNTASANTAAGYVASIIEKLNDNIFGTSSICINSRYLYNENNYTRYTILIGMTLALSVIQVLLLASLSVSREKEEGSYDMMIMTPSRIFEMLIGKAIAPVIIAMLQSLMLIAICNFYFEIPLRGNILAIGVLIAIFSFAIVGIGLAISTLSRTTMQSLITSFSLCLIFIMSSGLITAVDGMPAWFKLVAYCNPLYYGINAMWELYLESYSFAQISDKLIALFAVGAITMTLAAVLFKHKID